MIVSGYTLDLYCDRENKAHEYKEFPHQFVHELRSVAWKQARRAGWILNKKEGIAVCPKCSRKAAKGPAGAMPGKLPD